MRSWILAVSIFLYSWNLFSKSFFECDFSEMSSADILSRLGDSGLYLKKSINESFFENQLNEVFDGKSSGAHFIFFHKEMKKKFFLKIVPAYDGDRFEESIRIHVRLSELNLAPKLYFHGDLIEDSTGKLSHFFIAEYGKPYEKCKEKKSKTEIIEELAQHDVVHGDLDLNGNANLICVRNKTMVIDFDFSEYLGSHKKEQKAFKKDLEKFCSLNQGFLPSRSFQKIGKVAQKHLEIISDNPLYPKSFLPLCLCRKAAVNPILSEYFVEFIPDFSCENLGISY